MDLGVRGRSYLIVGGSRGMGRAAAATLVADGANVAVAGRDEAHARATAAALQEAAGEGGGADVHALAGDVNQPEEADRLVAEAHDVLGGLSGVAVTTGLGMHGQKELLGATDEDWLATFDDVLLATIRVCRAAVPVLIDGGGGAIVTTAAYSIRAPKSYQMPYATLKAGVANFTKNLAKSFGPSGVRANCVCPGATETDILAAMRTHYAAERGWPVDEALERLMVDEWGMKVALGRPGTPAELGDVIAFLLSDRASYVTGSLLNVDGGTDF